MSNRLRGVLSSALWALWVVAFVVLEVIGLRRTDDDRYTLTNRVRALMRAHPWARRIIRTAIAGGLLWLAHHFLVVDPETHPGAFTTFV